MQVKEIKIKDIQWDENSRVRDIEKDISELMMSIKQHGLEQPIGVVIKGSKTLGIFGFRRYTACKKLGMETIPCHILDKSMGAAQMLLMNTVENIQRKDITPNELGRIVDVLVRKHDMTFAEVSVRLGMNLNRIKAAFEMYKELPCDIRDKVVYHDKVNTKRNNGNIPANLAHKLLVANREVRIGNQNLSAIAD
ncbi:MAG: ParB/RepB/Spo0J family partition protein, partial [Candidatus Woesearchaeota archaeon]